MCIDSVPNFEKQMLTIKPKVLALVFGFICRHTHTHVCQTKCITLNTCVFFSLFFFFCVKKINWNLIPPIFLHYLALLTIYVEPSLWISVIGEWVNVMAKILTYAQINAKNENVQQINTHFWLTSFGDLLLKYISKWFCRIVKPPFVVWLLLLLLLFLFRSNLTIWQPMLLFIARRSEFSGECIFSLSLVFLCRRSFGFKMARST